ncbi:MAG: FAD binding domain-containing protein [Pseudomonadota bacterium]
MKDFKHYSPRSLADAGEIAAREGRAARFVAGGTDLLGTMKNRIHPRPLETLVDLKRIPGLDKLDVHENGLSIGALVRLGRLERDPAIAGEYGLLVEAVRSVASPQLRNMGTVGGNICQEPRCWYYRYPDNGFHCLRKGGDNCPALTGENRFHSVFGAARAGTPACASRCPVETDIPGYMALVRAGDWDGAARRVLEVNPMPAVTGRVCPHFCQDGCNRGDWDEAVSIRAVERRLGDYILDQADRFMTPPREESGRSAAVVGAGPAGLACAFHLRRAGHGVTVFDRLDQAGGMLNHAIPAYRLPRVIVRRFVAALENMGVCFRLGVELGRDAPWSDLDRDYETVFVAAGAWEQPRIGVEGEDLARFGLEFLQSVAQGREKSPGERVVVIGGGNVAVDVGLAARRLGAGSVVLACLEGRDKMPAHEWEIAQAEEEGVRVLPGWGPARITRSGPGFKVELVRCLSVLDDWGGFCPSYDRGEVMVLNADAVFLAVGQGKSLAGLAPDLVDPGGRVVVDGSTQETGRPGLYAGGDMVTGPASVIAAAAAGRRAAAAMAERLGRALPALEAAPVGTTLSVESGVWEKGRGAGEILRPAAERRLDLEDAETIPPDEARAEAGRCLNCGCVAASPADLPPALIALGASVQTDRRTLPAEDFFRVGPASSTVLEPGEIVTRVTVPRPAPGAAWSFEKFRRRNSIDFPTASAAVYLEIEGGLVKKARIVLGAAAPTPVRAEGAEQALVGGPVTEETAARAARAAVEKARPLAENEYKVLIIEALVRRNILAAAGVEAAGLSR